MPKSRFERGSGKYHCSECGKLTRETGEGESSVDMCKSCYQKAQWLNSLQDGDITVEQYEEILRKIDSGEIVILSADF